LAPYAWIVCRKHVFVKNEKVLEDLKWRERIFMVVCIVYVKENVYIYWFFFSKKKTCGFLVIFARQVRNVGGAKRQLKIWWI
jgi:hypothetical protein